MWSTGAQRSGCGAWRTAVVATTTRERVEELGGPARERRGLQAAGKGSDGRIRQRGDEQAQAAALEEDAATVRALTKHFHDVTFATMGCGNGDRDSWIRGLPALEQTSWRSLRGRLK